MLNLRNLIFVVICSLLFSCDTQKKGEEAGSNKAPESLVGTWKLKQRVNQRVGSEPEWLTASDTMIYNKNLTETHFTWIQYDKNNDILQGIGGGTYDYDGSRYVEHIAFFMPLESGILGQSINFTADFKDGEWYHAGYTKEIEFDPELAQMVVVDSNKIEEIWQKIETTPESNDLVGTWELKELKQQPDEDFFSYPDFINYKKLITPSHFVWIQYNDDGDEVTGAGSGTYSYNGKEYREQIQMIYPTGNNILGSQITFNCDVEGNRWNHFASSILQDGVETDSIYIDEIWAKIGSM